MQMWCNSPSSRRRLLPHSLYYVSNWVKPTSWVFIGTINRESDVKNDKAIEQKLLYFVLQNNDNRLGDKVIQSELANKHGVRNVEQVALIEKNNNIGCKSWVWERKSREEG